MGAEWCWMKVRIIRVIIFFYEFITPASRLTICGGTLQASEGTLQAINDAMQRIEANGGAGAINEASC